MQEFTQLRERALRVRRMATFVTSLPAEWRDRAERLTDYLCEPATANIAGFGEPSEAEAEVAGVPYDGPTSDYEM